MGRIKWVISGVLFISIILLLFQPIAGIATVGTILKSIEVTFSNIKIFINGKELIARDANGSIVEPFIYQGTTYVPLRAISEAFDKTVTWDQASNMINITDSPASTGQPLLISAQEIKAAISEDDPLHDYETITEITTREIWEKLGVQLFCFADYEGDIHDIPYLCNPCFIYENGKLTDLPGLPGFSGLTGFNAGNVHFFVADLERDGTPELLYIVSIGNDSYHRDYKFLYCYSKEHEIINLFGTDNYDYHIELKDDVAIIAFSSGEEAPLNLIVQGGRYYLEADLPDNIPAELQASIQHSATVKTHHLENPHKPGLFLSQASFIMAGMSIKEVYETLGLPQYFVGSGVISDGYDLNDGSLLIINYGANRDYVQRAKIRATDGSETILID